MRICFWAGPCSGKSTIAAKLFADLKIKGYSCELICEYIKQWAYLNRIPKSFDQCYIFGQQMHSEDLVFQCGVEHLITDSPLLMQPYYSKNSVFYEDLLNIGKKYEFVHPSLNIFLNRTCIEYQPRGRWETADQAIKRDMEMLDYLNENQINYKVFKTTEYDKILSYVESNLK